MRNPVLDALTVLMLVWPLYGTFYPPETYFYTGDLMQEEFSKSAAMPIILLSISAVAGLSYLWLRRRVHVHHDWFAYLFILLAFVSVLQSGDPGYSVNRALRLLPNVAFGVVYAQMPDKRHMLKLMVVAFLISACCSIVMGAAFPAYGSSHYEGVYENAWRGALGHKNGAGAMYGIGALVTIHCLMTRAVNAKLAAPTLAACLLMLVMSKSATAATAVTISLPLYLLLFSLQATRPQVRILTVLTVAFAVVAAVVISTAFPNLLFTLTGRDVSFTGRTGIWEAVWTAIQDKPILGHGYGFWGIDSATHNFIIQAAGFVPAHAHNDWLELWLQLGIFGLLAIVFEILTALGKGFVRIVGRSERDAILPFVIIVFMLARSNTEIQFCDPGNYGIFWLVWCAMRLRAPGRKEGPRAVATASTRDGRRNDGLAA